MWVTAVVTILQKHEQAGQQGLYPASDAGGGQRYRETNKKHDKARSEPNQYLWIGIEHRELELYVEFMKCSSNGRHDTVLQWRALWKCCRFRTVEIAPFG